ncbi:MAG TPA: efflux RND transporter periplasmic adaptor subunit, partial [Acidobacteriota bacterium]
MRNKKIIFIVGAAVIAAAVIAYFLIAKPGTNGAAASAYLTAPAARGSLSSVVTTTGTIQPQKTATIGSEVSGKVKKIYVDFNSKVKAGQLLAEIDPEPFVLKIDESKLSKKAAQLSANQSQLDYETARKNNDRTKELFAQGVVSDSDKENADVLFRKAELDLTAARLKVDQMQSQLNQLDVNLKNTKIVSPIDGIVVTRSIEPGQTVAASFTAPELFVVNDLNKMQIQCDVDETDMGEIKADQEASFTVQAFPNEVFTGKIIQVRYGAATVQNVVTYKAIVQIDNPDLKFRPGMTANVTIVTNTAPNALLVPNKAFLKPDLEAELRKLAGAGAAPAGAPAPADQATTPAGGRAGGTNARRSAQKPKNIKTVWKLGQDGRVAPVTIAIGISD